MKYLKSSRGFTLIEMLIVVTIIAVLASMILVGMGGARVKTRDARRISDLHNVQNGLELYFSTKGHYPVATTWDALTTELTGADVGVSRVPKDPLSDHKYYYGNNDDGVPTDYVLGATLEESANRALDDDIDEEDGNSIIYGVDCTDPVYCIRP